MSVIAIGHHKLHNFVIFGTSDGFVGKANSIETIPKSEKRSGRNSVIKNGRDASELSPFLNLFLSGRNLPNEYDLRRE